MSKPPSQVIVLWVIDYLSQPDWISLQEICSETLKIQMRGANDSFISEIIEENLVYIAEHLREYRAQQQFDGESPLFEIDDEEPPYVRSLKSDDTKIILEKLRRIEPNQFEQLCAKILSELGAKSESVGRQHDGGIDFYAINVPFFDRDLLMPQVTKAIIIGQAKRYIDGNLVSEKEVREFVGGGILKLHEYKKSPLTPVVYAFWTTSDFHESAKNYARKIGMWYMNGWSFAKYIQNIGIDIE